MFESALRRGLRMHVDSLTETPEREANRRKNHDAAPGGYFAKHQCEYSMETRIILGSDIVVLEQMEFRSWVKYMATRVQEEFSLTQMHDRKS
uniref:AlNc14C307G10453 protein n=1 Tax=Albugo laibachii Nc14 TaxID=890382 RepID=F0WW04_9STRA|nr:AlNc14C307G10453 [Albugo laibachii Nc14]|eukprot:CCA25606.1 AlNc14C307G10453 [Albugo laibachii Nc14]